MATSELSESIVNPRPRVYWQGDPAKGTVNRVQRTKNLGWLLANARYVTGITLYKTAGRGAGDRGARAAFDGERGGQQFTFICDFASYVIARRWVTRPSLIHAPLGQPVGEF